MKTYYLFCVWLIALPAWAQEVKVYTEKQGDVISFYADNPLACPTTVRVDFTKKLNVCPSEQQLTLIKPNANRQFLFKIVPCTAGKEWRYAYKYWYYFGDLNDEEYNANYNYALPYGAGEEYKVGQGFFGKFSHQDIHALDFTMPEGTPVCAMRDGVVVQTKSDSNKGGGDISFADYANKVVIYHADGTLGVYLHLKQNGAAVSVGERVKRGQVIGYSGNTGFSTNPHLHIEICLPYMDKKKTVEPKIKSGGKILKMTQGVFYKNEN